MSLLFDKPSVVIDNGSHFVKAGFACDNHPVAMFRNVVGRPKSLMGSYGRTPYDLFIGDDAVEKQEDLDVTPPIMNGRIVQWDNMERIWHHIFYRELKVAPEERGVILTCSSKSTIQEKIKCCEVFFESLNVPGVIIQPTAILSLYAAAATTGITVDLGFESSNITPVYEGTVIKYANTDIGYAGTQVCDFIINCMKAKNKDFGPRTKEILDDVIKEVLFVTLDSTVKRKGYQRYLESPITGEDVEMSQDFFGASEMFFQPDLVMGRKTNITSLWQGVINSALRCDAGIRTELYKAVVMSGGLSMIQGIGQRLQLELSQRLTSTVNVVMSDESYVLSWMGAAAFSGDSQGQQMYVTRKQYEDSGDRIIRKKFL